MKTNMRRALILVIVLLVTAAMCLAFTGCGSKSKGVNGISKIGFLHQDATWEMYQIEEAAVKAMCDANGIELVSANPSNDASKQLEQFDNLVNAGCNAVICVTIDGSVMQNAVQDAAKKGVMYISEFVPVEGAACNIAVDEYGYGYAIGKMAGEYCQSNFGDETVECALLRMHDYEPGIERGKGMEDAFKEFFPSGVVVNDQDSVDVESAMTATEAILAANPDCRVFLCDSDDTGAIGAYQALMAKVKPEDYDKYVVIGADGTAQGIKLTKEGGMYRGTIDLQCDKLGEQAFNIIMDLAAKKTVEDPQYVVIKEVNYDVANSDY